MSQLFTTGKVISNLELKASAKQNLYIHFTLVEQIGYGEQMHSQFIHVWAWGYQAEQLKRLGVRKGSIIWVSGALELEEFVSRDGSTRDKQLKLKLTDWGFVPRETDRSAKHKKASPEVDGAAGEKPAVIDGTREPLPE